MSLLKAFAETANSIEKPSLEPAYLESGFYRAKIESITEAKSNKGASMYVFSMTNVDAAKTQPDSKGKVSEKKEGQFTFTHRVMLEETEKLDKEGIVKSLYGVWASAYGDDDKSYKKFQQAIGADAYEGELKDKTVFLQYNYQKGKEFPVNINILPEKEWMSRKATVRS